MGDFDPDLWPPTLLPEFRNEIRTNSDKFMYGRAEAMKYQAEHNEDYQLRCVLGEKVFYSEDEKARMPGHIYSEAGKREFTDISHLCEFHFDEITREPEDADPNG